MANFKALATRLVHQTFGAYAKTLSIQTVDGSCENGTAIDITNRFAVDGSEDYDFVLVTDVNQWVKEPDAGNIDLVFDRTQLKIVSIDKDAAQAAYFIKCKTYTRKAVVLQVLALTPDGSGGYSEAWSTHTNIEAEVTYMDASEAIQSGRVETGQLVKFYFRYVAGITEKMRVSFNGEYLPIRSVNDIDAANEWVEIIAERVKAS
jgi:SPP1 family predicted phage head-tail adaptor